MEHDASVKYICATEYLAHVRALSIKVQTLQGEIETKRSLLLPSGIEYTERVSSSLSPDTIGDGVIKLQDLIAEYVTELVGYVEEQKEAHIVLSCLTRAEYTRALTGYYLHGKTWEQMCVDMKYSWDGMMKLRRKAVEEVYLFMPEQWRRDAIPNALPS